jgi:hypothetical protein
MGTYFALKTLAESGITFDGIIILIITDQKEAIKDFSTPFSQHIIDCRSPTM